MNQKDLCIKLLDSVPAYKMGYVVAYLQGLTADEGEDDRFCEQLLQAYHRDPDRGQTVTEEEALKELGIAL